MANEITTFVRLAIQNGTTVESLANATVRVDQATAATGSLFHVTEQLVGTAEEALSIGDVTTPGYVFLRNLDATNFITYGNVTTDLGFRLNPGEMALFRVKSGESILVQADTAACKLKVGIVAD